MKLLHWKTIESWLDRLDRDSMLLGHKAFALGAGRTFGRPRNAARFSGFYPASTCGHATGGGFWPSGNQPERVSTNPRTN
jgi:hypothetical protein